MTGKQLTVGLIGAGRIGRLHAHHLTTRLPRARLLAVADACAEAAESCARECCIPRFCSDYREILADPQIEAVLICSPTSTHAQLIEEAARSGKHIFCEKPLALDLETIDRALATVEQAGVKLQTGFNRRFDVHFRRVRQAVEQGEIGLPLMLHITSRDPAPPPAAYLRVSGGLFLDMTIHDFDMARFLLASEVEEVFALAHDLNEPDIALAGDVAHAAVMLRFANEAIATISNSRRASYGYDQRVELFGSEGSIAVDNAYPNTAVISDRHGVRRDLPLHFFMERYAESFAAELQAFVEAVLDDRPVPVSGHDGRAPVAIALAAQRSLREHRPVSLHEVA
ncbi:MAG: inositol 2-dehydrogenase [Thermogemmatispora sp.]|uniref:inositol 2-dehydrogenase n=1 Tax=Thermogemmatispora sp. TaxID=1968838 RepID=UPI00261A6F4D|nr:inositol 2-dehydrogenase [Thermogemmatispora sp.]MBX5455767.1 inositol 2-dehydrogenase [Thermogemmatispora sp.]